MPTKSNNTGGRGGATVSYTHLDVYKRQALGYGGSVGALKAMGALEMGLSEDELPALVSAWRQANPKIVQFWWAVDHAVMDAVTRKTVSYTHLDVYKRQLMAQRHPAAQLNITAAF